MRWLWARFRHLKGTTGKHASQRRRHRYDAVCYQCGVALRDTTKVAAHVVEQPNHPFGCGLGRVVLKTTCKRCNRSERAFWRCCVTAEDEDLGLVCC